MIQIHLCVALWGLTPILGKVIALPPLALVWWRTALVAGVLLAVPRVRRGLRAMNWRLRGAYAGIGALVALHWLTFYAAVKLSNASVGATCIALGAVFVALIEPWVTDRRFSTREMVLGLLVIPGVALVVGGVPGSMHAGIIVGSISAVLVAVFGALNKRMVDYGDALTVTALELGAGTLTLTMLMPLLPLLPGINEALGGVSLPVPTGRDLLLLLFFSFVCTLLPFSLSLAALRHMTAFGQQLVISLEPVYAIILAIALLGEQRDLTATFYCGVGLILASVLAYPTLRPSPAPA